MDVPFYFLKKSVFPDRMKNEFINIHFKCDEICDTMEYKVAVLK